MISVIRGFRVFRVFHNAEPLSCEFDQGLGDVVHLNSESDTLDRRAIVDPVCGGGPSSDPLFP